MWYSREYRTQLTGLLLVHQHVAGRNATLLRASFDL